MFKCVITSPILSPGQSRWGERQEVEPVHNFDHSFTVSVFHQLYWSRQRLRKFYSLYLGELFEEVGQPRKVQIGVRLDLVLEAQLNLKKDITTRILHQILEKKYELSICCRHLWDQIKHQKEETMQPIKVVKLGQFQSIIVQKYELQN